MGINCFNKGVRISLENACLRQTILRKAWPQLLTSFLPELPIAGKNTVPQERMEGLLSPLAQTKVLMLCR